MVNIIYVAISKIIVNRMRLYIDKTISHFQNTFSKGHTVHDNLLVVQEILHDFYTSKNKTCWSALKLDMNKV